MLIDNFHDWLLDLLQCPVGHDPLTHVGDTLVSRGGIEWGGGDLRLPRFSGVRDDWRTGQVHYETFNARWMAHTDPSFYIGVDAEITEVYARFPLAGMVLDVGGGFSTAAAQADIGAERYVSIDPAVCLWKDLPFDAEFTRHYAAVAGHIRIPALAEALPFRAGTFDTVHMRSCLDHFDDPLRALMEARRVLRTDGRLVVGLSLEGALKLSGSALRDKVKSWIKNSVVGDLHSRFFDPHMFHPTEASLRLLAHTAGFSIEDWFEQPGYRNVVYFSATAKHGWHPRFA